ncbi:MAG: ribosome maturation factor RimM [Gammaproteobacteria bacterium]|nr:ribosome maturation factor RimM [Gammaproteobacteria bacterium]
MAATAVATAPSAGPVPPVDSPPVTLGRINGLYGVRGGVRVFSHTRPPENILAYRDWLLCGDDGSMQAIRARGARHGRGLVAYLDGVTDREQARALLGARIAVPRAALPPPAAGEYYWHDLIGLRVRDRQGRGLGRIERLLETGAQDVLQVIGEREYLIPWVPGSVVELVDLQAGVVRVCWEAPA